MPLRNERQAYWDDIEENIALAPALSASARLARVCPEAAAAQAELRSRLHDLEIDIRATELARDRSHSLSAVAARERDAAAAAEEKRVELERAEAFVRGRLEGDRVHGRRPAFTRPEDLPRAGFEARRMCLGPAGGLDSTPSGVVAQAQRRANERWGAAETGMPMGAGNVVGAAARRGGREPARGECRQGARPISSRPRRTRRHHDGRNDRTGGTARRTAARRTSRDDAAVAASAGPGWLKGPTLKPTLTLTPTMERAAPAAVRRRVGCLVGDRRGAGVSLVSFVSSFVSTFVGFRRGVRSRSRGGRDVHEMATIRRVVDQVRVRLAAGDGVRRGRIVRAASASAPNAQHHILSAPGRLEVVYVFIDSRIIN